jgi:hypothetical protein
MKEFRINKNLTIVCTTINTRYGFKHEARLMNNGRQIDFAKCCYYNRTWESFEYESVVRDLLRKSDLSKGQQTRFLNKISRKSRADTNKMFSGIAAVAKLGEIFTDNQKESNDWKARMLKAGLTGLDIPDDWNQLDEAEKTKRLDNVINHLTKPL